MWKMLQQEKPSDYVIGTGETHSVEEFLKEAFSYVDLHYEHYVEVDSFYRRPLEVDVLCADSTKAKKELEFTPRIRFAELVRIMVDADMELEGLKPMGEGKRILENKNFSWIKKSVSL